jgi:hypothetical protein
METYRHSGAFSFSGILFAGTAGILAATALGFFYSFGIVHIPWIKVNFMLTAGFGCALGMTVGWCAKFGKIRNNFIATAYGFIIGLIGLYVAWGTDLVARVYLPDGDLDILPAYSPFELFEYVKWFYENGMWSIKADENVTGIWLAVTWSIEAAIIVGCSTSLARRFIQHLPFCEKCRRWTVAETGKRHLSLIGADEPLSRLLSGDLASLMNFELAENESEYLQLDMAVCPACSDCNYLTIMKVQETLDNEGKPHCKNTPLLLNMSIEAEYVPLVRNAGHEALSPELADEKPVCENPMEEAAAPTA